MNRCARCGEPAQTRLLERWWCAACADIVDGARWNVWFRTIAILKKAGKWQSTNGGNS